MVAFFWLPNTAAIAPRAEKILSLIISLWGRKIVPTARRRSAFCGAMSLPGGGGRVAAALAGRAVAGIGQDGGDGQAAVAAEAFQVQALRGQAEPAGGPVLAVVLGEEHGDPGAGDGPPLRVGERAVGPADEFD